MKTNSINSDWMFLEKSAYEIAQDYNHHGTMKNLYSLLEHRKEICSYLNMNPSQEHREKILLMLNYVNKDIIRLLQLKTIDE